jgi:hypothetical protein
MKGEKEARNLVEGFDGLEKRVNVQHKTSSIYSEEVKITG